jgi:hypothetical protein
MHAKHMVAGELFMALQAYPATKHMHSAADAAPPLAPAYMTASPTPALTHLAHGAVGLQEVGLEVHIKQVARDALNGVIDGQHMDALAVLDVRALQADNWWVGGEDR